MVRENNYFFISGFISFSLFSLFLFLFFYMMFSTSKINTFALNKDTYVSISLESIPVATKQIKKSVVKEKEVQEVVETKEVDIGDLFSDVWTKDITATKKEKKVDTKRLELIQKKIKTSKKNKQESLSEVIQNIEANETDTTDKKSSSGDEVNEYLAKIQAIVYKHFSPPENSQGYTVKAMIELSAIGKVLDFRIVTYSSNQALNRECDKIKDRLVGVLFPINPNNKSFSNIVTITSDK